MNNNKRSDYGGGGVTCTDEQIAVKEGDVFLGFCCQRFNWEVRLIFPCDEYPGDSELWGRCENPDCPKYQENIGPTDPYRGVGYICVDDLQDWIEEVVQ